MAGRSLKPLTNSLRAAGEEFSQQENPKKTSTKSKNGDATECSLRSVDLLQTKKTLAAQRYRDPAVLLPGLSAFIPINTKMGVPSDLSGSRCKAARIAGRSGKDSFTLTKVHIFGNSNYGMEYHLLQ